MHRPLTTAVHGNAAQGACSLVLAGNALIEDTGSEAVFAGRSVAAQLTGACAALARSCAALVNAEAGAEAGEKWRAGRPVRVIRAARGQRQSEFAPKTGYRYDGLYKVRVEKNSNSLRIPFSRKLFRIRQEDYLFRAFE